MDQEKARSISEAILSEERKRSEPLVRAGLSVRVFMDRLLTGIFTLTGAYFGWKLAVSNPDLGLNPILVGGALGLVVAVVFPARKT